MSRFDLILSGITAAALLALYVLLRYRVHVHVTYSRGKGSPVRQRVKAERRAGDGSSIRSATSSAVVAPKSGPVVVSSAAPAREQETTPILDIVSALSNLNVPVKRARAIALQVQAEAPGAGFDELIRKAVQKAREAA